MNYQSRIKRIEKEVNTEKALSYTDLLEPGFKYTGSKSFVNIYDALEYVGVREQPPYFLNSELQILFEKGLLKYPAEEIVKAMRENI